MNIIDLLESPGQGRPRDTNGVQSAADQSAASVIGSGTTEREEKKKPVTMMGKNVKEAVEEAAVKPNFKMPPESLQDKMYRQHQELRKQRGAPSAEEYKQRIAQKQAEIDALKEGILDRAAPKLPKPRNPADQVLRGKVNAAGKHLDKKRRQELAPKHKHQDPLDEGWKDAVASAALAGSLALGGMAHAGEPVVGQGQSQNMQMAVDMAKMNAKVKYMKTVYGDNFQDKQMPDYHWGKVDLKPGKDGGYQATVPLIVDTETQNESLRPGERHHFETDPVTGKRVYKGIRGQQTDAPQRGTSDPAAHGDSLAKAQASYDRRMTEQENIPESQAVKITDYDLWSDEVKALGGEIHAQKDRNVLVAQSWDGEQIGKFHLGKNMGFINQSGDLDETIRKMGSQYRLLSKKGKNLGTFDTKAGAEKHEREVQYFKHKNMEEGRHENDPKHVYDIIKYAMADAEKTGQKVVRSVGGFYKLAPLDDPRPALVPNTERKNKVAELQAEIDDLERIRLIGYKNPEEYKKLYYRKYGPHHSGPGKLASYLKKQIRDIPYAVEKDLAEGWKGKVAGAALAGAAALGGGDADAQQIDLPGPQVSYVAHVTAEANGREVHRTVNLGSQYDSEQDAYDDIERSLQAKGITRYNINIEQKYDAQYYPGSNQPRGGTATGRNYGTPGFGDMVINHIGREIRGSIPSKGGYATGGTNRGERPRDGSQWWRDQLPQMREDELGEGLKDPKDNPCWSGYKPVGTKKKAGKTVPNCVPTNEEIESHLYLMSRAGYDIVQEEWSDKYKRSINCAHPKGFSQKAHCAGRKKNEDVSEEKVRLDPKCWKGKKIGNPKTKMKGGVRVNNCVPK